MTPEGVVGDRCWGVRDGATGRILTARREPRLLLASARLGAYGGPVITLPDGTVLDGPGPATDAALRGWLGRDVALAGAEADPGGRAEFFADATDDDSAAIEWTMPAGRYHDSLAAPAASPPTACAPAGRSTTAPGTCAASARTC